VIAPQPPNIAWHPRMALLGAIATVPAGVVAALGNVSGGLGFAIGVLPAAVMGVPPRLRDRRRILFVGALFGALLVAGSLVGHNDVVAVVAMFVLPVLAAQLAARRPVGLVIMTIGLPLIAVGLSFMSFADGIGAGVSILLGSAFAYALSCITWIWPERPEPPHPQPVLLESERALAYGISLGLAAGIATLLTEVAGIDHPGWAPAAALFVMRPSADMQRLRSVGRVVSVTIGALVALALAHWQPPDVVVGLAAVAALAGAAGTRGSRWYVTPAFSTFVVIMMLLASDYTAAAAEWRFTERVGWTLVGVGLAYLFGLGLPRLAKRVGMRQFGAAGATARSTPP
jgi:hypothetical protein